tara:strand:+ start:4928 stop:5116 length:189 start_codon:yes stop_codon:yes gene_type:complete
MPKNKCKECGAVVKWEYSAPFQEYPGAKVWGGDYSCECEKCGWEGFVDAETGFRGEENTRGW